MTSTGIALVLLIAQLVCPSFAQQVTLERISPEDGLCLGDIVIYSCSVEDSHQLVWRYTDSSGTPLSDSFVVNDLVKSKVLGPLDLELTFTEPVGPTTGNIVSTATFASGLTAAEEGAVIACVGTSASPDVVISFAAPSITNVSYCMSTIYWSPPPCEANCTVTVDGQDIGSIPCESRNLNTDDSNLSNKMVMIVATDAIGSSLNISTVLNSEDCSGFVEMSTTTTMSSVSDDVRSTDSPVDSGKIAGIVFGVVFATCNAVISAIIVLIIFYRYRKKRSGFITMMSSRKEGDWAKLITVDCWMVQEGYHKHPIRHCALSPDAKYAATADTSMVVRLWEMKVTFQEMLLVETLDLDEIINGMKYADQKIKAITKCGEMKLLSLNWVQQEERSMLLLTYNSGVFVCDVSNKTVRLLYEPDGVRPSLYMRTTTSSMLCTACSSSHSTVALSYTRDTESTSLSGDLLLANINDLIKKGLTTSWKRLCEQDTAVLTMSFSPSNKKLVTGNIRGGIRIYTYVVSNSTASDYFEWRAHEGKVYDVQFGSADGEKVYSLGEDRKFYVWATSTTSAPLKEITFDNLNHAPQLPGTLTEPVERGIDVSHPTAGNNNLFRFCFEYEYILISSVEGKVVRKVDSHFDLTGIDLELPKGPISCLDCVAESLDNAKEAVYHCTTCILGSTDKSVKFVRLRCGYELPPRSTNQHHGGTETHGVSGGEEGDARIAAGNRVYYEVSDNQPLPSGSFLAGGDNKGQQAPSAAEVLTDA